MQSVSFMPSIIRIKTAESLGMKAGATAVILVTVMIMSMRAGTGHLQAVGTLRQSLNVASIKSNDEADIVIIRIVAILRSSRSISYSYYLPGMEKAPQTLGDVTTVD